MQKAIIITLLLLVLAALYPVAWVAARKGLLGELEFGYFKEYYVAKHAIEKSGCGTIDRIYANQDLEMEEIAFEITTRSGQAISLFFDSSIMDVEQVCERPAGLTVGFRTDAEGLLGQQYSIEVLAGLLKEKNVEVKSLKDVLSHLDELRHHFKANRTNQQIPRAASFRQTRDHLHLLFEDE
jgi:hypothetical protein